MTSLLVKAVIIPAILIFAMYFSKHINYGSLWQAIIVSAVLIAVGLATEYFLLQEKTFKLSVALDFITTFLILWGSSKLFEGASVTLIGAAGLTIIFGINEYLLHRHLIGSGKAAKTSA
ncbi:hypothetical protein [Thalassobacillus pellis]|uniref:hypothetical protein n=1 Tax=Thalassobacillus pellis TaxID=748008 RepID=UPI001961140C|nr:hypothetical protein [Thalassobacillus pellis]MBM7552119.1 hypothetical protein [Thalassobacillus pellis]